MATDTMRYIRHDTTRRFGEGRRMRADLMGSKVVNLDGSPDVAAVRAIMLGVACDRGVGLGGGRIGSADGPMRFRDAFWRLVAPESWGQGALLDAGDLVSAGRTDETHARLSEVVAVLRRRFPAAKVLVIGGGQDALYGDVLGIARWRRAELEDVRVGLVTVDAQPDAASADGEPHDRSALRRILREKASGVQGERLLVWGLQRAAASHQQLAFLRSQGAELRFCPDDTTGGHLAAALEEVASRADTLSLSVDLGAFAQSVAPGVSEPVAVGVDPGAVAEAAAALSALSMPTGLSVWGLNPRFDRDAATARLAARIAWSYVTGQR